MVKSTKGIKENPREKKNSLSEMKMSLTGIKSKLDTAESCPK